MNAVGPRESFLKREDEWRDWLLVGKTTRKWTRKTWLTGRVKGEVMAASGALLSQAGRVSPPPVLSGWQQQLGI